MWVFPPPKSDVRRYMAPPFPFLRVSAMSSIRSSIDFVRYVLLKNSFGFEYIGSSSPFNKSPRSGAALSSSLAS